MVDVKTLRIGSHVRLKTPFVIPYADGSTAVTEIIKVSTLNERKIGFYPLTGDGVKKLHYVLVEEVDPIPITEELLKELGFHDNDEWVKINREHFLSFKEAGWYGTWRLCHENCSVNFGNTICRYIHEAESFLSLHREELIKDY